MKPKIGLTIAITLIGATLCLMGPHPSAQAQDNAIYVADTGVITLGPNQVLRLGVMGNTAANGTFTFRSRQIGYGPGTCVDGVCKLSIVSITASDVITLTTGGAASINMPSGSFQGVRGVVMSRDQDMRVTGMIINTTTGEVDDFFDINTEFRRCMYPFCGG